MKGKVLTPYEMFWGVKPDVAHMKVFECKETLFVPSQVRDKLDAAAVSDEVIFVGYPHHTKPYRVWHTVNGKLQLKESSPSAFV